MTKAQTPATAVPAKSVSQTPTSLLPDINKNFLSNELDVTEWIDRFEGESREIARARDEVLKASGVAAGMRVADIGAGTGLYTFSFARLVGPQGWVYAVDISPKFLQHIEQRLTELQIPNVSPVLGNGISPHLPPDSVDVVFICDTYHHFEYPRQMLHALHRALRKDASIVLIDFEKIPDSSREWVMSHVRAGKDVFRAEIEQAGFRFEQEIPIAGFQENYFLRFRKM